MGHYINSNIHSDHKSPFSLGGSILLEAMLSIMLFVICFAVITRIYGNWIRATYESNHLLVLLDKVQSARTYYRAGLAVSPDTGCAIAMIQTPQPRIMQGEPIYMKRAIELACVRISETNRYGVRRTIEMITLPQENNDGMHN